MTRKVMLICCFALAHAGTLKTDYSSGTAVSYSSVRFGNSVNEKNSEPVEFRISSLEYLTAQERNPKNANIIKSYETDTTNPITKKFQASSNDIYAAPTNAEAVYPGYVPSGSRVLNFAKSIPTSRNIPLTPSPEFDSVPSVLKTEGLSAYASVPIETASPELTLIASDASRCMSKLWPLSDSSVSKVSVPLIKNGLAFSPGFYNPREFEMRYSETPVVSVSVSSSGSNYSW